MHILFRDVRTTESRTIAGRVCVLVIVFLEINVGRGRYARSSFVLDVSLLSRTRSRAANSFVASVHKRECVHAAHERGPDAR